MKAHMALVLVRRARLAAAAEAAAAVKVLTPFRIPYCHPALLQRLS
jgi:hypothetical protein